MDFSSYSTFNDSYFKIPMLERTSPYPTFSCCVHVVSSFGKKFIILRCRVWMQCKSLRSPNVFTICGIYTGHVDDNNCLRVRYHVNLHNETFQTHHPHPNATIGLFREFNIIFSNLLWTTL